MWIFDQETLDFLAVNDAAVQKYGYSRDEFLRMTILDIRPLEDIPKFLRSAVHPSHRGPSLQETWLHLTKFGTVIPVEITSYEITFEGRRAEVVQVSDLREPRL